MNKRTLVFGGLLAVTLAGASTETSMRPSAPSQTLPALTVPAAFEAGLVSRVM